MDFFANVATTTLAGTLSIPEPLDPFTSTHTKTHHHAPTSSSSSLPPPFEIPGHGHGHKHGHGGPGGLPVQHIGSAGEVTFWIVFAIFTFGVVFAALAGRRVAANLRLFHHLTVVILATAMISYLGMATGMGFTLVPIVQHSAKHGSQVVLREIYWARYADWAITTPLLLLDLALLAGLPYATIAFLALADEAMIATGLISALSGGGEKWTFLFFGISCAFFLYIVLTLFVSGRSSAKLQSDKVNKTYHALAILTVILWTAYPIVFALAEATGIISVNAETITYGILDVLAKFVFGLILIISHSHTEGDSVLLPDSWVHARNSAGAGYGTLSQDE